MASGCYNKFEERRVQGLVGDLDALTYYAMLVGASYVFDKKGHQFRSDITGELATGGGYTSGGLPVSVSLTVDSVNDRIDLVLGALNIDPATFSAAGVVYYVRRGGAASADEVVMFNDFGGVRSPSNVPFSVGASTFRIQQ